MRPEFGCRIHEYVFASADGSTANAIAAEVRAALQRWEPRIDVHDVAVTFDARDDTTLYIDIRYAIVLSIRDGKVGGGREFASKEEALEAAGLEE